MITENKPSEMSLDEVLSSIKKMVTDKEPPVLDLTDMVAEDGNIISIKSKDKDISENQKNNGMGAFLKLIQEDVSEIDANSDSVRYNSQKKGGKQEAGIDAIDTKDTIRTKNNTSENNENNNFEKNVDENVLQELVREAISPIIKNWINNNLAEIVEKVVEKEVKSFLYRKK